VTAVPGPGCWEGCGSSSHSFRTPPRHGGLPTTPPSLRAPPSTSASRPRAPAIPPAELIPLNGTSCAVMGSSPR
jgi:hypothetical protein